MAQTRVALIGLGDAGRHHAQALVALSHAGELQFTAVCARDPSRLAQSCRELALPASVQPFTALSDLLAAEVCDAVILATPDGQHAEQILRCAERGRHVLVEKPLALGRADAQKALAATRASGTLLRVGYHLRHHAAHLLMHARRAELIGALRSIAVRWAWPDPAQSGWRARGQEARFWSLAALGTHALDLAQWFADSPVEQLAAVTVPPPHVGTDRAAEVTLRFGSGVLAHISVAVTHRALPRLLLVGDSGELEALATLGARGEGELWWRPLRQPAQPIPFSPHDPYRAQLQRFLHDIAQAGQSGSVSPAATAADADALANIDLLDRIADSQSIADSQGTGPHAHS